jgi:hypothetical protein
MSEELCSICNEPRSAHEFDEDPAILEREEFERAVTVRAEQIHVEAKAVKVRVEHKLALAHGVSMPAPRSPDLDALELARITKLAEARDFEHLVSKKVQDARAQRGDAEYVTQSDLPTRPTRDQRRAYASSAKDVEVIETRNGPVG